MEAVRSSDANMVGEREAWTRVIMGEVEGARRLGIFFWKQGWKGLLMDEQRRVRARKL